MEIRPKPQASACAALRIACTRDGYPMPARWG